MGIRVRVKNWNQGPGLRIRNEDWVIKKIKDLIRCGKKIKRKILLTSVLSHLQQIITARAASIILLYGKSGFLVLHLEFDVLGHWHIWVFYQDIK